MKAPYFADQIDLYEHLIDHLQPDEPGDTEAVARATLFAIHHAIVGHGSELLERVTERFAGTMVIAHLYRQQSELVAIGEDYVIHHGASNYPHLSFAGSEVKFGVDPSGQPLFSLSADLAA